MRRQSRYFTREKYVYLGLIIIGLIIFGKLFYLQILNASELKARGASLRATTYNLPYERGAIYDAQGNILAMSVAAMDIYADPKTITNHINSNSGSLTKEKIAEEISSILEKDSQDILNLLKKDLSWVSLGRQVDLDKSDMIKELALPGIGFNNTYKRVYPTGKLTSSVLGIVNMAGDGVEGLEHYYNNELAGENYIQNMEESQWNKGIRCGNSLKLTLDSTIQHLVELELDKMMENCQPERAAILAMDPKTGRILGMGSRPTYDANNYLSTSPEQRKNLTISMIYEPGSTFKIITGAGALEESTVTPQQIFNDPGYLVVNSRTITNWDSDRRAHGNISFADGMRLSSNIVLAQVGQLLGKDLFDNYLKSFGFGSRTKIDISGEEQGLLLDVNRVKDLELSTMSFGQANLVTPVQLLTAVCAVANGGTLYQPYIVDSIMNKEGKVLLENEPQAVREVISRSTSLTMTDILVDVVDKGTGGLAKIPGVKVAGKTGTAQKLDPAIGGYSTTDFIASFIAYAPAHDPKIAVLVIADTPKGEIIQGGTLAAPHVRKIIEGTLRYYGIPVSADTSGNINEINSSIISENNNNSSNPKENVPPSDVKPEEGEVAVPDLKGLNIRQAGELLGSLELRYKFSGSGLAVSQFPQAGQIVNQGDYVEVVFKTGE